MSVALAWTIRARITALVAALVMAVGGILLLANYGWLTRNLPSVLAKEVGGELFVVVDGATPIPVPMDCTDVDAAQPAEALRTPPDARSGPAQIASAAAQATGPAELDATPVPMQGACVYAPSVRPGEAVPGGGAAGPADAIRGAVEATSQGMTASITTQLGRQSLALLGVLGLAAVVAGWLAASRALAPIHAMNERARRLGATSLSERLPLTGARDEIAALGATFNGLLERVEQAVAREHRLLANLAHELRTPLANQRIVLEVAMEGNDPRTEADVNGLVEAARTALQQNLRTQRLVEQLLMLARIEQAGDAVLDVAEVDLIEVVDMLIAAPSLARLGPPGVRIVLDTPESVSTTVCAAPLLLDCLVGNLLENAVRHNLPGGLVRVAFPVPPPGSVCELLIENTGPVVPADVLPRLFEPLRQGPAMDRERQPGRAGIGLGLALVVAITERFDIELRAEPRADGGLVVRLRWPAAARPQARRATH